MVVFLGAVGHAVGARLVSGPVTRGLLATRRADRTAIVMPAMFALGWQVIGNLTGGDVRGPA